MELTRKQKKELQTLLELEQNGELNDKSKVLLAHYKMLHTNERIEKIKNLKAEKKITPPNAIELGSLIKYENLPSAMCVISDINRIKESVKDAIIGAYLTESINNDITPMIFPTTPIHPESAEVSKKSRSDTFFAFEYNYFVQKLSEHFTEETRDFFIYDFRLKMGKSTEVDNTYSQILSTTLEQILQVAYINSRNTYKSIGSSRILKSSLNYYSAFIVKKISDKDSKEVVQMNCIVFRDSFIRSLYACETDYIEAGYILDYSSSDFFNHFEILATTPYACNEYWLFEALKRARISVNKFRSFSPSERKAIIKNINVKKNFFS